MANDVSQDNIILGVAVMVDVGDWIILSSVTLLYLALIKLWGPCSVIIKSYYLG
jgi:hypothetical protein